ncbi:MAG: hypothetical protein LBJ09_03955 [Clostridiales bacterium]|nr:hypothetical protein [Clostridiales bacterium]
MSAAELNIEKYEIKNLSDIEELIEKTEKGIDSLGEQGKKYSEMEKFLINLYKLRLKLESEAAPPEAPPESTDAETFFWGDEDNLSEAPPESEKIVLESPPESAELKTFSASEEMVSESPFGEAEGVNLETYSTWESETAPPEAPPESTDAETSLVCKSEITSPEAPPESTDSAPEEMSTTVERQRVTVQGLLSKILSTFDKPATINRGMRLQLHSNEHEIQNKSSGKSKKDRVTSAKKRK